MTCEHKNFHTTVKVARLEDSGRFMADINIHCTDCKEEFQFLGLKPGLDLNGATVSIDGLEARIAIAPKSKVLSPLQQMVAGTSQPN